MATQNKIRFIVNDKELLFRMLAILGGALFFANQLNTAIFVRVFTLLRIPEPIPVYLTAFIPFLLSIPLLTRRYKQMKIFLVIYLIVFIYFVLSILFNLEDLQFYFRPAYGVEKVFIPSGGIFAIYYILLLYRKNDYSDLKTLMLLSAVFIFAISVMQFGMAKYRGHWLIGNSDGELIKSSYSMVFGFNMALAVNLFIAYSFIRNQKIYLLPAAIGYSTIMTDGNRMAIVLPVFGLLIMGVYMIIDALRRHVKVTRILTKTAVYILGLVLVFVLTSQMTYMQIESAKRQAEINKNNNQNEETKDEIIISRNIQMLESGSIMFDNSRDEIHSYVLKGVKESPILGLGAFGDRPLVVPHFIWGHSHGIHLELWSNLGILFGLPFVLYLANTFFAAFTKKKHFLILIYLAFVGTAALHLTSWSFWLEYYIWAAIGLSILFMKKEDYWAYKLYKAIKRN